MPIFKNSKNYKKKFYFYFYKKLFKGAFDLLRYVSKRTSLLGKKFNKPFFKSSKSS